MSDLANRRCEPCHGGTPRLSGAELSSMVTQLDGWLVVDDHHLRKEWTFPDFALALAFVNRLAEIAEAENHHPDIQLGWGRVGVEIWTHAVGGLTESDVILAAKFDRIPA